MSSELKILFVGDVVGEDSLKFLVDHLPKLKEENSPDMIIVNGENVWQGKGLNEEEAQLLFDAGTDVITTGNHVWENWKSRPLLAKNSNVLRPYNYPPGNTGRGFTFVKVKDTEVAVLQVQGRTYMQHIDCPFRGADHALKTIAERTPNIIIDFHAEATAEKMSMAWHLDGQVSAIIGTHTHVPTDDAQILPKGTAYLTDVGMTGPHDSVLGMRKDVALKRYLLQTAHKYEMAEDDIKINAALIKLDSSTGQSMEISRFTYPEFISKAGI